MMMFLRQGLSRVGRGNIQQIQAVRWRASSGLRLAVVQPEDIDMDEDADEKEVEN
jgi:hypothetical protein